LEYLYGPTYLLVLILALYFSKKRINTFLIFIASSLVPNLPLLIFDLKHHFYNLTVLWSYSLDVVKHPGISGVSYYDFLQFWPVALLILAVIIVKIWNKNKIVALLILCIYIFINVRSPFVVFDRPTGMPKDLTLKNIETVANLISKDKPANFNVAVINDFDTRGHILRYSLEYNDSVDPNSVEDYPSSQMLYVLAPLSYNFSGSHVWEIQSFNYKKEIKLADVSSDFGLFKLTK
jgi:hypothetical protein